MSLAKTKHVLVFGFLAVLLASCARVPELDPHIVVLADGDALRKDAAEYAKLYGVNADEALRRLELQRVIGKLDATIAEGEPETYAGLWVEHKPKYRVVVNIAGDPSVVSKYTAGGRVADITQAFQVEKSLKQLELEQAEAAATLNKLGILSESEVNVRKNQAEIYVLDAQQVESLATARSTVALALDDVNVTEVDSFSQDEANAYAGFRMNSCTSGYSVFDGNGLYGITTAGHCGNTQNYEGVSLNLIREWNRGAFDVQWHVPRPPNPGLLFKPWARDNQPSSQGTRYYREMYSPINRPEQAIGLLVCKYGRETGFTCGEIASKTFNPVTTTPTYDDDVHNSSTYIRVDRLGNSDLSGGGDSGGPWYEGHGALGLHSGGWTNPPSCSNTFCGDAIYMAINYLTDTGLRVFYAPR